LISTNHFFPAVERLPESFDDQLASLGIKLFDQAVTGAVTITPGAERLVIEPTYRGEPLVQLRKFP
jgi:hypothetical protein